MSNLLARRIDRGHGHRRAAVRRYAIERTTGVGREDDYAGRAPRRAPASAEGVAEDFGASAGGGNGLQLGAGREADAAAVGGPERQAAAVGVLEMPRCERVE